MTRRRATPLRIASAFSAILLGSGLGCNCESSNVGALKSVIQIDPMMLDLGEVPLGVKVKGALTVKSAGEAMLTIRDVRLEGPEIFRIAKMPARRMPPSSTDVVEIEASPTELGPAMTELVIASDDAVNVELRVPIRLVGVPDPPCDDGNPCTNDGFDKAANACEHTFNDGSACSPADKCIVDAVCSQGVCLGRAKTCDDSSSCTKDYCNQATGECVFIDDPMQCDDDNPCTTDSCRGSGCVHDLLPSGTPCDDHDLCTSGDACFAGTCRGTGAPDGSACDDNDSCTVEDTCLQGQCSGRSIITAAQEGDLVFTYHLEAWPDAFLHRREVSLSDDGIFYGLDHQPLTNPPGLAHVIFAMKQCGTQAYEFTYRPPDSHVLVRFVRREMQVSSSDQLRVVVGVRQLPDDGYEPQTTTYLLDAAGNVNSSQIQTKGGETGRSLLPDESHIFGTIWPLTEGAPTADMPAKQNLVIVREDRAGNVLWRRERDCSMSMADWCEYLGVAGPRVLFWANGRFGALDFNTGNTVWTQETARITKEMALSTNLNLGVARAQSQLVGVEILTGRQIFTFPSQDGTTYFPRTDPVISADGRVLVLMQRNSAVSSTIAEGLDWVELSPDGSVLSTTPLPYVFPSDSSLVHSEDDPYPTVADDGVSYVGYGSSFFAIDPGGHIRWTLTSTVPNAFTGTVPLLRDDGILLISEDQRLIRGIRSNGGKMSQTGWASFRHDGRRTNFTP
jgi:putative pyrroloquinoline-quinone binding quinoprotein/slime mold repeat-containing protein